MTGAADIDPRVWALGDPEPADCACVSDAYGWKWRRASGGGWWAADQSFADHPRTWWWLTMNRGPLREVNR